MSVATLTLEPLKPCDRVTVREHLLLPCVQAALPHFELRALDSWVSHIMSDPGSFRITADDQLAGVARLGRIQGYDFAYWIHPNYRRRGLASLVNKELCDRAKALGWPDIRGTCHPDNLASQTILSREGFQRHSETLWVKQLS